MRYRRLEPYAGKLARTVLRGESGREAALLPDIRLLLIIGLRFNQNSVSKFFEILVTF